MSSFIFTFSPGVFAFNEYCRDMQFTTPYMKYTAYSNRYFIVPEVTAASVFWRAKLVTHDDQNELSDSLWDSTQLDKVIPVRQALSLCLLSKLLDELPSRMSEDVVRLVYSYLVVGSYQVCDTNHVHRMYPLEFTELPEACPPASCRFHPPTNMCDRCFRVGYPTDTYVILDGFVERVTERRRKCQHGRVLRNVGDCYVCYPDPNSQFFPHDS